MTVRKLLFWPHLIAGTVAGIVVLIMSVTGVLLMYEKQMIAWLEERDFQIPSPHTEKLPLETLIVKFREQKGATPSAITLRSDPASPAVFTAGREGALYVNPYTGQVLGSASPKVRNFFRGVTEWHRWVAMGGASRPTGKAITGASNLAFLFLVVTGFFLWWPKRWTWQHLRPVVIFRGGLSGKARDFNWHNVIGIWCAVPLFFIVLGATVFSYPWASNLVYRMAGETPPKSQGPPRNAAEPKDVSFDGLNRAWQTTIQSTSEWRTITLRLPGADTAPIAFTVDAGYAGQPQKRTLLTLDRATGSIEKAEPFSSFDAGRRARTWLRFVHTGEYYGLAGQTIAGIASAGGAVLVWTGIALAFRRLRAWTGRRASRKAEFAGVR